MFLFNLDNWKLHYGLLVCFIFCSASLRFLLAESTDHFEDVRVRVEAAFKVLHEVSRLSSVESSVHPQELVRAEKRLEVRKHGIDGSCDPLHLLFDLILFFWVWIVATSSIHIHRPSILDFNSDSLSRGCLSVQIDYELGSWWNSHFSDSYIEEA